MKKISRATKPNPPVVPSHRSFRRFVRKMFISFLRRQSHECQDKFQTTVLERLQDIEDSIEIVARQIARWVESGE